MVCLVNTETGSMIQWPDKGPVTALGKLCSSCRTSGRLFRATSPTKPNLPSPQAHAPFLREPDNFVLVCRATPGHKIHSSLIPQRGPPFPHSQLCQNGLRNTYYSLELTYVLIFVYSNCCIPPCLECEVPHRQETSPTAPTTMPCI